MYLNITQWILRRLEDEMEIVFNWFLYRFVQIIWFLLPKREYLNTIWLERKTTYYVERYISFQNRW